MDEGIGAQTILNESLLTGMDIVGEKFGKNEIFVPEVLLSARAMNSGPELLKPLLRKAGSEPPGRACIGTVKGDLHDIGKNLVRMMLEGKDIEVIDLGVDVSAEQFVECAKNARCQLLCCDIPPMSRWENIDAFFGAVDEFYAR